MKIACLGWGSLIWKAGALPVASQWHHDGVFSQAQYTGTGLALRQIAVDSSPPSAMRTNSIGTSGPS